MWARGVRKDVGVAGGVRDLCTQVLGHSLVNTLPGGH